MAMKVSSLYPYQDRVSRFAHGKTRVGLLVFYGGGKTYLALKWLETLTSPFPCLILCPTSVIEQWGSEIEKFTDYSYSLVVGTKRQREKALEKDVQLYVINYDALRSNLIYSILRLKGLRTVIADESTMLKEARTQRFKNLYAICRFIPYRTILTGSIITERPEDLFSQMLFLDDGVAFGKSYWRFRGTYFNPPPAWKPYTWGLKEDANAAMACRLASSCILIPKETVLAELPPKRYTKIHFSLNSTIQPMYRSMKKEFAMQLPDGREFATQWVLVKTTKLHQLCNGFLYEKDRETQWFSEDKIQWITDNVPLMLKQGPVIIWTHYHAVLERLQQLLPCAVYHGLMQNKERTVSVQAFMSGKTDILILSEAAGHRGLNLQRANQVIFHDCSYSAAQRLNAEDRTHRIGSEIHEHITYYDLVTVKTIDEVVLNAIRGKISVAKALFAHLQDEGD